MSDPIKQQMLMQRGSFLGALAGLSMLPILLGMGPGETIVNQMKATPPECAQGLMLRGGLAIPSSLLGAATKVAPLAKNVGISAATGFWVA